MQMTGLWWEWQREVMAATQSMQYGKNNRKNSALRWQRILWSFLAVSTAFLKCFQMDSASPEHFSSPKMALASFALQRCADFQPKIHHWLFLFSHWEKKKCEDERGSHLRNTYNLPTIYIPFPFPFSYHTISPYCFLHSLLLSLQKSPRMQKFFSQLMKLSLLW